MSENVKNKIEELAVKSQEDIRALIDNSYAWEFEEDHKKFQGEVVGVWEDKEKGIIRLVGYKTPLKTRWWNNFFSKSVYEKIIKP